MTTKRTQVSQRAYFKRLIIFIVLDMNYVLRNLFSDFPRFLLHFVKIGIVVMFPIKMYEVMLKFLENNSLSLIKLENNNKSVLMINDK